MKFVVTGAAGRLGSETVAQLHAAGHDVVATDVTARRPLPVPSHEMNLLDREAVASLIKNVDAVVHLGNHIGVGRTRPAAQTFNDNVAMNMNVFQAAIDAGATRVIFASTVQVMASESGGGTPFPPYAKDVAYLPMDRNSPKNPGNAYALSKSVGETMLEQYVAPHGVTSIALRFPQLSSLEDLDWFRNPLGREWHDSRITQAFSVLSNSDGAAAIVACLTAELSGYHVFFPAVSQMSGELVRPAIEQYYRGVPLKHPIEQIDSLVDHSHLTQATGWRPQDVF